MRLAAQPSVLTFHNDAARTGQNLAETILTHSNVNSSSFGKLFLVTLDSRVDAQPLYVPAVPVPGQGTHNLLIAATENDSLYALDADSGAVLWQTSVLGSGETPSDTRNCNQVTPTIGITATPVIHLNTGGPGGVIYAVAMSKDSSGKYYQRLHALDLASGVETLGGPVNIQARFPGAGADSRNGYVFFDPKQYTERAALLYLNGVIYLGFSSHCDHPPYTGWILGYNASTLKPAAILNVTPNGAEGSIWSAGGGLAADSSGNIYFLDANGTFDATFDSQGFPINGDFGNAFIKLSTGGKLAVADYFAMYNTVAESQADEDLGSGGAMVLPDMLDSTGATRHLAIGAGKDANIYLVDRDNMGKFNPQNNNAIYQELTGVLANRVVSTPAYYNGLVYYCATSDALKAFQFTNARLSAAPVMATAHRFPYPGATPAISANGAANGIVWVVENSSTAVLHAYSAGNLRQELYNSNQAAGGRDQFGPGNKFMAPTVVNGKVYVGTPTGIAAFGLL
jgi:hypothetical protein